MSGVKRLIEDQEEETANTLSKLMDAGAVEQCEIHEDVMVDTGDHGAQEEVREELSKSVGPIRAEQLVRQAMEGVAWECPLCGNDD